MLQESRRIEEGFELLQEDEQYLRESGVKVPRNLKESWDMLGMGCGGLSSWFFGPDADGSLWQSRGSAGPYPPQANVLLYIVRSLYFNRLQRWICEYLYQLNSYAGSAVRNLTTLIFEGYAFTAESDAGQRALDDWWFGQASDEYSDYGHRCQDLYEQYLTRGEVFLRISGRGPASRVRSIHPDFVYSSSDMDQGVFYETGDYETVEKFQVNDSAYGYSVDKPDRQHGGYEEVPGRLMQHRKNAWAGIRRGFSALLPVYKQLMDAEQLLRSLVITADVQARFAVIKEVDAPKDVTKALISDVQNQVGKFTPIHAGTGASPSQPSSIVSYPPGSIIWDSKNVKTTLPSTGIQGSEYVEVLRAILRQIATNFDLPEAILSQDADSIAAYTGQLVSNSYLVKAMQRRQAQVWRWDQILLKKCGFDVREIHPVFGEVASPDKRHLVETIEMGLDREFLSKCTAATMLDVDYESEQDLIKQEKAEGVYDIGKSTPEESDGIEPGQPSKDKGI